MSETAAQAQQRRAELAMWGCFACAQPWIVTGKWWGLVWGAAGIAAWLVARHYEAREGA